MRIRRVRQPFRSADSGLGPPCGPDLLALSCESVSARASHGECRMRAGFHARSSLLTGELDERWNVLALLRVDPGSTVIWLASN